MSYSASASTSSGGRPDSVKTAKSQQSVDTGRTSAEQHQGSAGEEEGVVEVEPDDLQDAPDGEVSESGKFKQVLPLLSILRKTLNVKDLTSVRLSLPATMLEPLANLEYWQYCDRPDYFAAMPLADTEEERMFAVLRWTFTKDLKFVRSGIKKPFNSILGEHFHCTWDVPVVSLDGDGDKGPVPRTDIDYAPPKEILAAAGVKEYSSDWLSGTTASEEPPKPTHRVAFVNCQTSHHPPISHFWLECRPTDDLKGKGRVIARGADHLSAKFTGTNVKVMCGPSNKGIFVELPEHNEEYQITHPTAVVAGLLRGNPYATVTDYTYVTCRAASGQDDKGKTRYRAMIHYQEESWLLKPKYLIDGIVYKYEVGSSGESWTKPKQVPQDQIVAHLEGSWRGEIRYRLASAAAQPPAAGAKDWQTLVNLIPLTEVPKRVAPLDEQDELESRKVWAPVIDAIERKEFSKASKAKQAIEQRQRDKADERKRQGVTYEPVYFRAEDEAWSGRPTLTDEGKRALEQLFDRPVE